jgi:site-specific DNA-methyltransferase (adenine-specific)
MKLKRAKEVYNPVRFGNKATLYNLPFQEACGFIEDNSIDAILCDPPYGIEFMGSSWDTFTSKGVEKDRKSAGGFGKNSATNENGYAAAQVRYANKSLAQSLAYQDWCEEWAIYMLRILKPGGYFLSFGGTRTYHRLTCGIENAGFEIRDMLGWCYLSGFPKSHNISKSIDSSKGLTREVIGHKKMGSLPQMSPRTSKGVDFSKGGIGKYVSENEGKITAPNSDEAKQWDGWGTALKPAIEPIVMARKPFKGSVAKNVQEYGTGAINVGESRVFRDTEKDIPGWHNSGSNGEAGFRGTSTFKLRNMQATEIKERCGNVGRWPSNLIFDEETGIFMDTTFKDGMSRIFYCPKPSKKERDLGLDEIEEQATVFWQTGNGKSGKASSISEGRNTQKKNIHPTVKPVALLEYLWTMICPPGGLCLDSVQGSGSSGVAALLRGFDYIGIERDTELGYFPISVARIGHTYNSLYLEKPKLRLRRAR